MPTPPADIAFDEIDWTDEEQAAIGDVRTKIPDTEQLKNPIDPTAEIEYLFSDVILGRYLATNNGNIKLAVADACEALGTSEALILKKITEADRATDGAALMKEYVSRAKQIRADVRLDDAIEDRSFAGVQTVGYVRRPHQFDAERVARGPQWF